MKNRFLLLQPWITLLFRLILGGVLLAAGGLKVGHLQKSAMAVRAYEVLPISVANVIGYSLPWIEVGLAIFLILGVFVKQSAMASGALMFIFIIGIAQAGLRGLSIDCGCFGGGGQVAAGQTKYLAEIFRDVGLLAIALALTKFPGGKFGLDRQ
ncbi:MAG: DoxX family membrane protein [Actinobacteria bacterium]|jgi:uncharacterized membrane protein YphA (DoxX/SURF4 family)|nr:DoxX family membrane protein [Actinomycetota bacterium]